MSPHVVWLSMMWQKKWIKKPTTTAINKFERVAYIVLNLVVPHPNFLAAAHSESSTHACRSFKVIPSRSSSSSLVSDDESSSPPSLTLFRVVCRRFVFPFAIEVVFTWTAPPLVFPRHIASAFGICQSVFDPRVARNFLLKRGRFMPRSTRVKVVFRARAKRVCRWCEDVKLIVFFWANKWDVREKKTSHTTVSLFFFVEKDFSRRPFGYKKNKKNRNWHLGKKRETFGVKERKKKRDFYTL